MVAPYRPIPNNAVITKPPRVFKGACEHCECEFNYTYADLDRRKAGMRRLHQLYCMALNCPGCGSRYVHQS